MRKVSMLNEYGEFPLPEEHPCRNYVDKGDRQRWNTSISEVSPDSAYMRVQQELYEMYDALGSYQAITDFSGGRLKSSTVRGIICMHSHRVKSATEALVDEVYEKFRRGIE